MNIVVVKGFWHWDVSCRPGKARAFSLVEVVLALGIVSFALLGIVALLPAGIQLTRDSLEETGAINVLSGVIADRRTATNYATSSPLFGVASLNASSSNAFGVTSANTNTTDFTKAVYRVTYVVTAPTAGDTQDPYLVYFKVSWPASAPSTQPAGYVEDFVTFPQP